jgi:DNA polymerase-4
LASDWNKPDGIKVITKEMIPGILEPLPVRKVHGLGKKSVEKLNKIGIFTIGDMFNYDRAFFDTYLGKMGSEVYDRISGIDHREVSSDAGERKSIGTETTLSKNVDDVNALKTYLSKFSLKIGEILDKKQISAKTVTIKLKSFDFIQHTRSKTLNTYICKSKDIELVAHDLLEEFGLDTDIRLIGLTVSNFEDRQLEQLNLFDNLLNF